MPEPRLLLLFIVPAAVGIVIVTALIWRGRVQLRECPYYDATFTRALRGSFDLFVSYKSEDAHFARGVVDQLLARGIHVWFAEYCILTTDDVDDFQARIDHGIANSSRGVVITSPAYFKSPHTLDELRQLVSRGASHVKEMRIAPSTGEHRGRPHTSNHQSFESVVEGDGRTCVKCEFKIPSLDRHL